MQITHLVPAMMIGFALIISAWIVAAPSGRFSVATAGSTVIRLDTQTGEMIACRSTCFSLGAPIAK